MKNKTVISLIHALIFITVLCLFSASFCSSQNPAFEQRRTNYIDTALSNFTPDAITLQAYRGVPVDTATLHSMVSDLQTHEVSDFDIVKLIRVLFFTNGAYDTLIIPPLIQVPFWLRKNDSLNCYWSENHMIMWMSSDWLLHQRYGKAIDSTLDKRLRHYLRLKIRYGFYEFFSSVYAPYCLSGLLNLVDFSQDIEIKTLATQAAQRLLKDLLMLTNDKGVFYPAAGRNYFGKYATPYGQNHSNLIYLLTGFGQAPSSASHAGGFLASSTLPVDDVINSWTPYLDTLYHIGHSIDSGFIINRSMYSVDRIIFQWSAGEYFHPSVAVESATLLRDSNLWNHVDFAPLHMLSSFPIPSILSLTEQFPSISTSSVICGQDVAIFKHKSITLSSIQDFWKGRLGYQQMPCVANIGTTAVLTASGIVESDWNNRSESGNNQHLPYVKQKKNVALLMYRPEPKPAFLNYNNPEVALRWMDNEFNEVINDSLWVIGRQDQNYIGVRKSCNGTINGIRACNLPNGQSWVFIVGDSAMYGGFTNFRNIIGNSHFEERWYYDSLASQSVYYAKIVIDTITIEYAWGVDSINTTGIHHNEKENQGLVIFPNPTTTDATLNLTSFLNQPATITMTNILGQEVYKETISNVSVVEKRISLKDQNNGIYIIRIENNRQRFSGKIIRNE